VTYYADLTPYTYDTDNGIPDTPARQADVPLLNVGWLCRERDYPKGRAPAGLAAALHRAAATDRVQQTRGYHFCPWCVSRLAGRLGHCARGSAEIRVVGDGVVYAAPELIAHYVEAHDYLPPEEFVHAVMSSGVESGA
jgi:hypothetical protein